MRIGIVTEDNDVAQAWEARLVEHVSVREVILVKKSEHLPEADACLIIVQNEAAFREAALAITKGLHCFLISKLPTRREQIERLYHFAEESGVLLQLAHWISYAPATQWIHSKLKQPTLIHIDRRLPLQQLSNYDNSFSNLWIDDLAYCIKTMGSNVHKVEVGFSGISQPIQSNSALSFDGVLPQLHLFLRFDNAGSAVLFIGTGTQEAVYKRIISNSSIVIEHDVLKSSVTLTAQDQHQKRYQEVKYFQSEEPADRALTLFLKAIQTRNQPEFSIYDSLKLTRVIQQIEERIFRIY